MPRNPRSIVNAPQDIGSATITMHEPHKSNAFRPNSGILFQQILNSLLEFVDLERLAEDVRCSQILGQGKVVYPGYAPSGHGYDLHVGELAPEFSDCGKALLALHHDVRDD